jgi:hypothetical protein
VRDERFDLPVPVTAMAPPDPPPAPRLPLPMPDVLRARLEALRSAALTSDKMAPIEIILERAEEFEGWLLRGLDGGANDGW